MFNVTKSGSEETSFIDIRVGEGHVIHQLKLDATALAASRDANGNLPPGLPVREDGTPVSGADQTIAGYIGPEPVKLGDDDIFGNAIFGGGLNLDAIEDNLGRVLSANELAAKPSTIVLR